LRSFRVLVLEALEAAFGIHDFVRARVKRVAIGADVHFQIGNGAADFDAVTARAGGGGVYVLGVNADFHTDLVYYKSASPADFSLSRLLLLGEN
jgi:hypothetical protein